MEDSLDKIGQLTVFLNGYCRDLRALQSWFWELLKGSLKDNTKE